MCVLIVSIISYHFCSKLGPVHCTTSDCRCADCHLDRHLCSVQVSPIIRDVMINRYINKSSIQANFLHASMLFLCIDALARYLIYAWYMCHSMPVCLYLVYLCPTFLLAYTEGIFVQNKTYKGFVVFTGNLVNVVNCHVKRLLDIFNG